MSKDDTIVKVNDANEIAKYFDFSTNYFNSIDMKTDEGRIKTLNAFNGAQSLNDYMKECVDNKKDDTLHVVDIFTTPGMRKSRDSRLPDTDCINTYLITAEGNALMSQSNGIADSVKMIHALFPDCGKTMKNGYIPIKVIEQVLSNGNSVKKLVAQL